MLESRQSKVHNADAIQPPMQDGQPDAGPAASSSSQHEQPAAKVSTLDGGLTCGSFQKLERDVVADHLHPVPLKQPAAPGWRRASNQESKRDDANVVALTQALAWLQPKGGVPACIAWQHAASQPEAVKPDTDKPCSRETVGQQAQPGSSGSGGDSTSGSGGGSSSTCRSPPAGRRPPRWKTRTGNRCSRRPPP